MNSAARQAAEQIAALINSRVQSPRIDEMEAIIAGVTARHDTPQDDQTLAALRQKIAEVARTQRSLRLTDGEHADLDKADAADNELTAMSKRIFAARPITIHNLKLRAVTRQTLARARCRREMDGAGASAPRGKTRLSPT